MLIYDGISYSRSLGWELSMLNKRLECKENQPKQERVSENLLKQKDNGYKNFMLNTQNNGPI